MQESPEDLQHSKRLTRLLQSLSDACEVLALVESGEPWKEARELLRTKRELVHEEVVKFVESCLQGLFGENATGKSFAAAVAVARRLVSDVWPNAPEGPPIHEEIAELLRKVDSGQLLSKVQSPEEVERKRKERLHKRR